MITFFFILVVAVIVSCVLFIPPRVTITEVRTANGTKVVSAKVKRWYGRSRSREFFRTTDRRELWCDYVSGLPVGSSLNHRLGWACVAFEVSRPPPEDPRRANGSTLIVGNEGLNMFLGKK